MRCIHTHGKRSGDTEALDHPVGDPPGNGHARHPTAPQVAANPCTHVEDPDAEELCKTIYKCKPDADVTRGVDGSDPYEYSSREGHTIQVATVDYFSLNSDSYLYIAWVWLNVDC